MTTAIQRRRGTTSQHTTFTGLLGEVTVDTDKDTLVVHDGSTAGGFPLLREDLSNNTNVLTTTNTKTLSNKSISLGSNTLTGTIAQFNAAVTDSDFVDTTSSQTIAGTKTFSSNPILSAGTANGVLYLNGSKVATSGSALTFDGTNFATTGAGTFSGLLSRIHAQGTDAYITNTTTGKANTVMGFNDSGSNTAQGIPTGYSYYGNLQTYPIGFTSGGYLTNSISSTAHIWNTTGSEQMRLTSTGLGIGTSSPAYKLDVSSSAEVVGRFARSAGSNALLLIQDPTTTAAPYIASYGNAMAFGRYGGGESVRIDSNGNFLVNTTTSITGSNRMVVRQSGTSNPSTALNSGSWTGAFVSGEPALQLSSNIVAATGIPGSTETARGGIGFEYISSANPTDFIIGIFGSPTVASPVKFFNGSERMRLDSSGNLGLGVTPSAWRSTYKALQTNGGSFYGFTSNDRVGMSQNAYVDATSFQWTYTTTAAATNYLQISGEHQWYRAASGTAGTAITFTQAMTLDASGNLGIGTSSPSTRLQVNFSSATAYSSGATGNGLLIYNTSTTNGQYAGIIFQGEPTAGNAGQASIYGTTTGSGAMDLVFSTRGSSVLAERARIDSSGNLLVGTTSSDARLNVKGSGSTSSTFSLIVRNSASGDIVKTRDDGYVYLPSTYNNTSASAANIFMGGSGELYRSTSSLKYKTNVQDATHGLADLLKLRSVTYQGKSEADAGKTFGGLIAEEVDAAGLTEFVQYAEDGSPDALAYGNMVSLCIKAIQEQQAIIEQLKADVAALKGA